MRVVYPLVTQQRLEVNDRLGGMGRQLGGRRIEGKEAHCPVACLVDLAPRAFNEEVGADGHQLLAWSDLGGWRGAVAVGACQALPPFHRALFVAPSTNDSSSHPSYGHDS